MTDTEQRPALLIDNPYWEAVRDFPRSDWFGRAQIARWKDGFDYQGVTRDDLVRRFSWAVPTPETVEWLVQELAGRPVVEIGAGTGYWAWLLGQAHVDVVCYDAAPPATHRNSWHSHFKNGEFVRDGVQYRPVFLGGPEKVEDHPDRVLFLCWPYMNEMAADALRRYAGDTLVYIGESECGCTADDDFFALLAADWEEVAVCPHHLEWDGLNDFLTVYRRRQ